MRKVIYILFMAMLTLTACDRRDLEVMEPQKTHFRLEVDWLSHYGERPSGMTVMLFGDNQRRPVTELTNEVSAIDLDLEPDHYRLVIFNQSASEFGSMRFEDTGDYDLMNVRATSYQPLQPSDWTKGQTFQRDPEKLGTVLEEFDITEEMLLSQVTFMPYKAWLRAVRATTRFYQEDDLTYVMRVVAEPVLSTLYVRVHVQGIANMRSVEGSISGMADGYWLTRNHATAEDDCVHLLDGWTTASDGSTDGSGWVIARIPVFGEPYGKEPIASRQETQHRLKLHFLLRDGQTTADYEYNVGRQVRYIKQDDNGVWQYTDEVTPYLVLTIWDKDPGDKPYDPTDPDDPNRPNPGDPDNPDDPDDPDNPNNPDNPDKPHEPTLPDVESDGAGFEAEVADWEDGGTFDVGL